MTDTRAVFISQVKDGKCHNGESIRRMIAKYEGQKVKITIEKYRKRRTLSQNNYYWGVLIEYAVSAARAEDPTITPKEMHQILKQECGIITKEIVIVNARQFIVDKEGTTTDKTTTEFSAYVERCRQWIFVNLKVVVPLPNEEIQESWLEPTDYAGV
jgi:hypothetical protein